jgi:glucosamine--fructose-6-phosphate aminotransferase (isomerizing)
VSSIVGYIGKRLSRAVVLEGIQRLEYRGYDCAGFACLHPENNRILYAKVTEKLQELKQQCEQNSIDGRVGIGHLRLATHGVITHENTHPQFDCQKSIALVHNGIIENYHRLKEQLEEAGHTFLSTTDSEVIAHLFEDSLRSHKTCKDALIELVTHLEGAYSFAALLQGYPEYIILVRRRSPLYIGIGDDEVMISSGLRALSGFSNKIAILLDESFALIQNDFIELYDFSGKSLPLHTQEMAFNDCVHEKYDYEHYMLKEIYEQKNAIHATVEFLNLISSNIWEHIGIPVKKVQQLERIHLIGSGSSWHAARIAQFFFEHIAQLPTQVSLSSEFRFMPLLPTDNTIYGLLSQSGETADTLEALRLINNMDLPTIALTNEPSSTLVREANGFLLTQAGHENAAASTKSFSTQLVMLYWFAHRLAIEKGIIDESYLQIAEKDLLIAAEVLENSIENYKFAIEETLAKRYSQYQNIIFLGRHISYPFAMEATLKLKKISYIFAECYPAGELKHGSLTLIDATRPVFLFSHSDPFIYRKLLTNVQEIKARGGHIVAFLFEDQDELKMLADHSFIIPRVKPLLAPIAMAGLMQFFIYQIAKERNCTIDKPRNIGKTVIVE